MKDSQLSSARPKGSCKLISRHDCFITEEIIMNLLEDLVAICNVNAILNLGIR